MPSGFAPPYSVADTIQQILQQRRETSRQAMIDRLNEEDTRSNMSYREGQLKLGQSAEERAKRDLLLKELMMIPGGADPSSVDPKKADAARGLGLIRQRPAQNPVVMGPQITDFSPDQAPEVTGTIKSGVEQPFLPGREAGEEFVGNEQYQQRTRAQEDIDRVMGQFAQDPDTLRALVLARSTGADLPQSIVGPKPSFTPINPNTGAAGKQVDLPRGGEADVMPHPPSSYIPSFLPYFDPAQNKSVLLGNRLGPNGQPQVVDLPNNMGPLTRPGTEPANRVAPALSNRLSMAKYNLEAARGSRGWFSFGQPSTAETAALAEYQQALGAVFAATGAPDYLQQIALGIAADPEDSKKPIPVLAAEGAFDTPLTPEEEDQLTTLLNYARGAQTQ